MKAMRFHPRGYGGERRSPEQVKRDGWQEQGLLAVAVDDERLTWPERELVRQLGEKLYGKREEPGRCLSGPATWSRSGSSRRRRSFAGCRRSGSPATSAPGRRSSGPRRSSPRACRRPMRLPPPSTAAISRMEEAITWNRFLERDDAHLMWARAEGAPWKELCYRFGISRPTAHRRWEYALSVIVWRLNGRQVHHRRGRRFVVAQADRTNYTRRASLSAASSVKQRPLYSSAMSDLNSGFR